mmetsp:Transcript_102281/g.177465  ORF Transcript_102281/g.177465 Transcript_102281/m.177465 type:complete len:379 (+) Transcript_102281:136-1272(+)
MAGVSAERRRLTVGTCDAPGARGGNRALLSHQLEDIALFATLQEGKKGILLASKTDRDLNRRRSFSEKDTESVVPEGQNASENEKWLTSAYGIGYACRKGLKPESPNQDSFFVLAVEDQFVLFCVLDGHGPYGHDISNIARTCLLKNFLKLDFRKDPEKSFKNCFVKTQEDIESQKESDASSSGSTCSMALFDFETDKLTVAHVGDSRAVLGKKIREGEYDPDAALTEDHKPNLPAEKRRIENSNPPGRVEFDGYYNYRVFAKHGSYPGLNMSRAFGDVVAHKEAGLTAVPDTKTIDLKPLRERFPVLILLVCTDGVWEFIENNEALQILIDANKEEEGSRPKEQNAAAKLAKVSWDRWMADSDNEISDDITIVWTAL